MGFLDAILGRSRPAQPRLDSLFAVPSAAITLEAGLGLRPTGAGSVVLPGRCGSGASTPPRATPSHCCERRPEAPEVEVSVDEFGFTWLRSPTTTRTPRRCAPTCTRSTRPSRRPGSARRLLCSLVVFAESTGRRVGLVYLYKQGTFYPFAASGPGQRETLLELQVRDALRGELPLEESQSRWLAVWGAPGL